MNNLQNTIEDDYITIRKQINNIEVVLTKTKKYTNCLFNVYFLTNLDEHSYYLPFIAKILSKCNNQHKTMEEQYQYLYELYGSAIYGLKVSNYKTTGIYFSIDVVNQDIVNQPDLYQKCFENLRDVIYDPLTSKDKYGNTIFDKKNFEEEKINAINNCRNEANDKRTYANYRFLKKMTKKGEVPLYSHNTMSTIDAIKNKDLFDYYQYILNHSKIIINAIGDIQDEVMDELIRILPLKSNSLSLEYEDLNNYMSVQAKRVTEKAAIKQAHIHLGYRTDIVYRHELYPAYILFSIMFGELPSSTLFSKIREEQGLCYTIYNSINPIRNTMHIYAGVDNSNINITIQSIKHELKNYQDGTILKSDNREYFENLLVAAKNELKNEYINASDSQTGILVQTLKDTLTVRRNMKELYLDGLKVTLEDIVAASNHLALDTIYSLKGESK